MNVLYFDTNELWSPTIDDLYDEYQVDVVEEDFYSVSKESQKRGKYLAVHVAMLSNPTNIMKI